MRTLLLLSLLGLTSTIMACHQPCSNSDSRCENGKAINCTQFCGLGPCAPTELVETQCGSGETCEMVPFDVDGGGARDQALKGAKEGARCQKAASSDGGV